MAFNPLLLLQAMPVALEIIKELKGVPKPKRARAKTKAKEAVKKVCHDEKCSKD